MYKYNILYWIVLPLGLYAIYVINNNLSVNYNEFLGFAENKQTEINLDYDIKIEKIHVKIGDNVKMGDILMEVSKSELDEQIKQLDFKVNELNLKSSLSKDEINAEILALESDLSKKILELEAKISTKSSESNFYKTLLKSSKILTSDSTISDPNAENIAMIQNEIKTLQSKYGNQINLYKRMSASPQPTYALKSQALAEKEFLRTEKNKFKILAPYDGTIGTINARVGENIKSYTGLISFYETTPPIVIGYIPEKFDINIQIGDRVTVSSIFNPNKSIVGIIAGKGHRIIEIPEKFRKIPDFKTYGLEVFINIEKNNRFYQKEVLKIRRNT